MAPTADLPLVRRSPVPVEDCNLAKSFELVGDHWTLLVLRSALYGVRRFDDFCAELAAPRSVLSRRLAFLVERGLMEKRDYREEGKRARTEYFLTDMGRALGLPFMAMTEWADRWVGGGQGPLSLESRSSGDRLRIALVDSKGQAVPAGDVETVIRLGKKPVKRTAARKK